MLEAALLLADEYCEANGLDIVGYYQANELSNDMELGAAGKKICENIRANCSTCATLLIDGASMRPSPDDLRLVSLGADGKMTIVTPIVAPDADTCIKQLNAHLDRGAHQKLVDFDVHLDDCSKDWTSNAAALLT